MSQIRDVSERLTPLIEELAILVLLPLFLGWTLIARRIPKKENLWVFGPSGRGGFLDNSKYLFLYASRETDKRCVWFSKDLDDETHTALAEKGYEAYSARSLRGRYLTLRAEYVFLSYRADAALKWFVTGSKTIQLWHGNPLKRINVPTPARLTYTRYIYVTYAYNRWTSFVVTSDGRLRRVFQEKFALDDEQILTCGYPRNDSLIATVPNELLGQQRGVYEWAADQSSDIVLYLPTFRGDEFPPDHNPFHPDNFPLERLAARLEEFDAHLLVKPHPKTPLPDELVRSDRITPLEPEIDIYPLLREVDVLLTDYSSVLFDYLLVDQPIVFYAYDYDAYDRARGFYFDYHAEMPGPIAETPEELLESLATVVGGRDDYQDERRRLNERINAHGDGNAAARIVDVVNHE